MTQPQPQSQPQSQIMTQPQSQTITDVVIDIETLGTDRDAIILSIGAAAIAGNAIVDTFYTDVDIQSSIDRGFTWHRDTVDWWSRQSRAARLAAFGEHMADWTAEKMVRELASVSIEWGSDLPEMRRPGIKAALARFITWGPLIEASRIWGNSNTFDCGTLAHAATVCDLAMPWKYWAERDFRTAKDIVLLVGRSWTSVPPLVPHHALSDAVAEATSLINLLQPHADHHAA